MTHDSFQSADVLSPLILQPLRRSGSYRCPLRPSHAQHTWLVQQFPADAQVSRHYPLIPERVLPKIQPWGESILQAAVLPFTPVIELSELPGLAVSALARFTRHQPPVASLQTEAPMAWLLPEATVLAALRNGEYTVNFRFSSTTSLYHQEDEDLAAFQRAMRAEIRIRKLEAELKSAREEVQMLSDKYGDYGGQ
jgi:hypothetical protein